MITYEIKVYNQGTALATNIVITDFIPTGMSLEDANWNLTGSIATLKTPIASLSAGASTSVFIKLRLSSTFQGSSIKNVAEISSANDKNGNPGTDIDSTPDQVSGNDAEIDDEINKTPATGDEDDADPASINVNQVFDLALTKKLSPIQGAIKPGDNITFIVKVYNQGTVDAQNITITDYIPTGLTLNDPTWNSSGANATQLIPFLGAGQSVEKTIVLKLDANYQGTSIVNKAEISSASNLLNLQDKDSNPDSNATNDAGGKENTNSDDAIDGNGTGNPGDTNASTDEDDEDPAIAIINQTFDLALTKKLAAGQSSTVNLGDNVTYTITVYNQGTIDATQINVVDYIPSGMTLNDPNWTLSGSIATYNTPIAYLAKGSSVNVNITLKLDPTFTGTKVRNVAEISSAKDNNGNPATDIDSYFDNQNGNTSGELNPTNDVITENGKTGGDEDDHDYEDVTPLPCTLAIDAITPSTCSCSNGGADVTASISWSATAPKRIINITLGTVVKTIDPNLTASPTNVVFNNVLGTVGTISVVYVDGSCPTSKSYTIVKDTEKPVFTNIPADRTLECKEVLFEIDPTITDNCTKNVPFTFKMDTIPAICGMTIKCIWTATDNCGNVATAIQTVTVKDTKAPVITNNPQDVTIECGNQIPTYTPIWTDVCDNNLTLSSKSSVSLLLCGELQEFVYTATDDCGNSSSVTWKITITDTKAPVITGCPANATVECDAVPQPANPTVTDICDRTVKLVYNESKANGNCTDSYVLTRTWTATDNCNNNSQCVQTITVRDTKAPVIVGCPANVTVECDAVPNPATPTATDNCDSQVSITYNQDKANGNCTDSYVLTRTWIATDNCNNNSQCVQTITVRDTKAPVIAGCPANVTVECDAVPNPAIPTATDNCDSQVSITTTKTKQMEIVPIVMY
ncbi:MAG: DUF11 domain-containing protein [Saprospiraceae bacterium]|nr:DUF11 domain-containing protein [Saprospiraceae bacterium]